MPYIDNPDVQSPLLEAHETEKLDGEVNGDETDGQNGKILDTDIAERMRYKYELSYWGRRPGPAPIVMFFRELCFPQRNKSQLMKRLSCNFVDL